MSPKAKRPKPMLFLPPPPHPASSSTRRQAAVAVWNRLSTCTPLLVLPPRAARPHHSPCPPTWIQRRRRRAARAICPMRPNCPRPKRPSSDWYTRTMAVPTNHTHTASIRPPRIPRPALLPVRQARLYRVWANMCICQVVCLPGGSGHRISNGPSRRYVPSRLRCNVLIVEARMIKLIREQQDELLARAVAIHGEKWDLVSKGVPTRSYHQVRQR